MSLCADVNNYCDSDNRIHSIFDNLVCSKIVPDSNCLSPILRLALHRKRSQSRVEAQGCRRLGAKGPWPPHLSWQSVYPISTIGADYSHYITTYPIPQILRTSYGPESCRSPKSSASATLYASSCWKFIADDDRNTTKARNPGKCKVIRYPQIFQALIKASNQNGFKSFQ